MAFVCCHKFFPTPFQKLFSLLQLLIEDYNPQIQGPIQAFSNSVYKQKHFTFNSIQHVWCLHIYPYESTEAFFTSDHVTVNIFVHLLTHSRTAQHRDKLRLLVLLSSLLRL